MTESLSESEIGCLAEAYSDMGQAQQFLLWATGLPFSRHPLASSMLGFWRAVNEEIRAGAVPNGRRQTLLRAFAEYPKNPAFQAGACLDFQVDCEVCITKFDDQRVADKAMSVKDWGDFARYGRVGGRTAEAFFAALCDEMRPDAVFIRDHIQNMFAREKIRFYATSSTGFYLRPGRRVDPTDCGNVATGADGVTRVRGMVRPINVLEPVRDLADTVRRQRSADRRSYH